MVVIVFVVAVEVDGRRKIPDVAIESWQPLAFTHYSVANSW